MCGFGDRCKGIFDHGIHGKTRNFQQMRRSCRFLESLSMQVFPPRRQDAKNFKSTNFTNFTNFLSVTSRKFLAADVADERRFREGVVAPRLALVRPRSRTPRNASETRAIRFWGKSFCSSGLDGVFPSVSKTAQNRVRKIPFFRPQKIQWPPKTPPPDFKAGTAPFRKIQ